MIINELQSNMKIQDAEKIIFGGEKLKITASQRQRIENSYQFLKEFSKDL